MTVKPIERISLPVINETNYIFSRKPKLGDLDKLEKKLTEMRRNLDFSAEQFQSARALPSEFYTDKQIWKAMQVMLRQNWQAIGHLQDVKNPLDYFTLNYASGPLLVIRDKEGILRAFNNKCTHRKKILVAPPEYPEKGNLAEVKELENTDTLKCFYHGLKHKYTDNSRLPQYVVDTWGPIVFVLMKDLRDKPEQIIQEKERLSAMLAPLKEITKDMDIESFEMKKVWEDIMKCHFGIFDGNFCDTDHLKDTHPKLYKNLDYPNYTREYFDPASLQTCPIKKKPSSKEVRGGIAYYYKLPPTLAVNIYKENRDRNIPLAVDMVSKDVIDTNLVVPMEKNKTKVIFGFHFPPGVNKTPINAYIKGSKRIQKEDRIKCEDVQIGHNSDDIETDLVDCGAFLKPEKLEFLFQDWMLKELEKVLAETKR